MLQIESISRVNICTIRPFYLSTSCYSTVCTLLWSLTADVFGFVAILPQFTRTENKKEIKQCLFSRQRQKPPEQKDNAAERFVENKDKCTNKIIMILIIASSSSLATPFPMVVPCRTVIRHHRFFSLVLNSNLLRSCTAVLFQVYCTIYNILPYFTNNAILVRHNICFSITCRIVS